MTVKTMRVAERTLGSLRDRWNDSADNFEKALGLCLFFDSITCDPMGGPCRKMSYEAYSMFLAAIAYRAGAVKAKGGSFDDWLDAVEELSEWRHWNLL